MLLVIEKNKLCLCRKSRDILQQIVQFSKIVQNYFNEMTLKGCHIIQQLIKYYLSCMEGACKKIIKNFYFIHF